MNFWKTLNSLEEFDRSIETSFEKPVLIFKHSTRCSISSMSLDRFNRAWKTENESDFTPYYLDLITYRDISNAIAEKLGVQHESPQVLLIKDGKCIFSETHQSIRLENALREIKN